MSNNGNSFEENMAKLEQIVRAMERGDVPLEDALRMFQEGTVLISTCSKMLDDAQLQVKKILPDENGMPSEEDFADASE